MDISAKANCANKQSLVLTIKFHNVELLGTWILKQEYVKP